ncbi:hypothetical protein OIDMADRAFT_139713 [Oidiodendron maius Zn]|uniref:C2H2-type domain-containing protein n=1 Tax=Oidiodendron maius (strain Zn) TaxID=913774 RepID=A0A0C3HVH2_OIDMZ|nr:hypothetical protein OIDMADRAFT_139713 [Oidiodendron maius Zn]
MAPFRYEPIDLGGPAFRLVRLLKGSNFENIQCELFQAWLPPVGGGIPYEALSYTWGGTEKPDAIEINGSIMDVTLNLYLAMQHLRFEDRDRILWIDAICIDQDNIEERGHQVQQMANIYKQAEQVLIWLGSATDEIDLVMNSMKRLQEESFTYPCHDWKHADARWMEIWSITQRDLGYIYQHVKDRQREGLELLLRRSWFRRIWILQEVANARAAIIVCGTKSVSARIFALAPSLVGVNPELHCQAVLDIFPGSSRKYSWWSEKRDLYTLLVKFGRSEATEPRDIIYALLGMSSDAWDTDLLRVDYSKPEKEVICEATSFLLSLNRLGHSINLPHWTLSKFLYNLNSLSGAVLNWTMRTGQEAVVKQLLGYRDIDVNWTGDNGQTLLLWAAERGDEAVAKLLIERSDTDMNLMDRKGRTPLSWAAERGDEAVVKLLIERSDTDMNLTDRGGRTPLSWAARHKGVLLERSDTDVNLTDREGWTPLSWAAERGHEAVLIERSDTDMNLTDREGRTPLSWAVKRGDEAVVKLLIERSDADVNLTDRGGRRLLSWAAERGHEAVHQCDLHLGAQWVNLPKSLAGKICRDPNSGPARKGAVCARSLSSVLCERSDSYWNHARALVTKYPPQIVLWIIREVSCEPRDSPAFSGPPSLFSMHSSDTGASSIIASQAMASTSVSSSTSLTSLCQKFGDISGNFHKVEVERRLFCVFEEHKEISFGRRSDWRKHMASFHKPDKMVWQCPECYEYFDQMLNYNQHHLIHHCQRKTCKHSNTATKLRYSKRAFACGRQSCERLLYTWDEWQNHVIEHMEDRMSEDEWQYNTFFRNLFRREEIHSRWEKYVSDQLGHYNVVARFNWRPRNTLLLRLKLEYFETISDIEADKLVEDAYQIGLEVRTAHELLDPSTLITEPSTIRSQTGLSSYEPSLQGQRIDKFNLAIEGSGKDPKESPSQPPDLTLDDAYLMISGNGSIGPTSPAQHCEMPVEDWNISIRTEATGDASRWVG